MTLDSLTTSQVAKALDVSAARVIQMAVRGEIAFEWTPLGRLYDAADVERISQERAARKAALAGGGRA